MTVTVESLRSLTGRYSNLISGYRIRESGGRASIFDGANSGYSRGVLEARVGHGYVPLGKIETTSLDGGWEGGLSFVLSKSETSGTFEDLLGLGVYRTGEGGNFGVSQSYGRGIFGTESVSTSSLAVGPFVDVRGPVHEDQSFTKLTGEKGELPDIFLGMFGAARPSPVDAEKVLYALQGIGAHATQGEIDLAHSSYVSNGQILYREGTGWIALDPHKLKTNFLGQSQYVNEDVGTPARLISEQIGNRHNVQNIVVFTDSADGSLYYQFGFGRSVSSDKEIHMLSVQNYLSFDSGGIHAALVEEPILAGSSALRRQRTGRSIVGEVDPSLPVEVRDPATRLLNSIYGGGSARDTRLSSFSGSLAASIVGIQAGAGGSASQNFGDLMRRINVSEGKSLTSAQADALRKETVLKAGTGGSKKAGWVLNGCAKMRPWFTSPGTTPAAVVPRPAAPSRLFWTWTATVWSCWICTTTLPLTGMMMALRNRRAGLVLMMLCWLSIARKMARLRTQAGMARLPAAVSCS